MYKKIKTIIIFLSIMLIAGFIAGCSQETSSGTQTPAQTPPAANNDSNNDNNDGSNEEADISYTGGPATVTIVDVNSGIRANEDWVENFFVNPVKKQYPEIEVVMAQDSVQNLITAGSPPDLVLVSNPGLHNIVELELPEDLTEMITKYNINLDRFDQAVVNEIRRLSNDTMFYGIPFSMNYGAMLYNKDIFDRFGVDYPKDGMDWDETYELARQLTRVDEGVQYIGILPPTITESLRQFTVPVVNPETNQAELTTPKHVEVFSLVQKFYSIPGYMQGQTYALHQNMFYGDQVIAMYPWWLAAMNSSLRNDGVHETFNWDLTTFPVIPGTNIGKQVDFHMAVVNKNSPNKEAAYQVVLNLISDEVQTGLSRVGRISPVVDDNIRGQFAAESNIFEGKNVQAIFTVQAAPMPYISKFNSQIESMLHNETMRAIMVDKVDINTALRQAEEKANREIIIED